MKKAKVSDQQAVAMLGTAEATSVVAAVRTHGVSGEINSPIAQTVRRNGGVGRPRTEAAEGREQSAQ